jgi:hypothetical protein
MHLRGGTEEAAKTSVRIAGVPLDIRTEYLLNTRLVLYRYTSLLGLNKHVSFHAVCCKIRQFTSRNRQKRQRKLLKLCAVTIVRHHSIETDS